MIYLIGDTIYHIAQATPRGGGHNVTQKTHTKDIKQEKNERINLIQNIEIQARHKKVSQM